MLLPVLSLYIYYCLVYFIARVVPSLLYFSGSYGFILATAEVLIDKLIVSSSKSASCFELLFALTKVSIGLGLFENI